MRRSLARLRVKSKCEEGELWMDSEVLDRLRILKQQPCNRNRARIADIEPKNFWWRAAHHAELNEVLILRHEHASLVGCDVPQPNVRSATKAKDADMQRTGKSGRKSGPQPLRQVLVKEQPDGH